MKKSIYDAIYQIVRQIPTGKVMTYGSIARLLGGCTPRMVGYAMASTPDELDIPWQRVVNSRGQISERANGLPDERQQKLLEAEGVVFDHQGRLNLQKYLWGPEKVGPA